MADWKMTFNLIDVWGKRNGEVGPENWTDKTVHELAKEIARRIERKFPTAMMEGASPDPTLVEVYDWFKSIQTMPEHVQHLESFIHDDGVTDEEYRCHTQYTPMRDFNACMGVFYDWADRNLVWINT